MKKVQFDISSNTIQEIEPKEADIYGFRRELEEIESHQREIETLQAALQRLAPTDGESLVETYQDFVKKEEIFASKVYSVESKANKIISGILERQMTELLVARFEKKKYGADELTNGPSLQKLPGSNHEIYIKEMLQLLIRKNRIVLESKRQIQLEFMKNYWRDWMEEYSILYEKLEKTQ